MDILLTVSHSVPQSVVPYTSPEKGVQSDDADEFSDGRSMNLFEKVGVSDTEDITTFLLNYLYSDVMVMAIWWLVGIISIFLDPPY